MKYKLSVLIIIVSVVFTSCNSTVDEVVSEELCSEMLYFDNVDEMYAELNKVQSMTDVERNNWEKSKGFKSLGLESERLYASIVPEDFKSVDEVKQFVESNCELLELVEDENGEYELDNKFDNRDEKYFMNRNHMYQIGDSVYKVFYEGIVIGSSKDLNVMLEDGNDISFYCELGDFKIISNKVILKSVQNDCGTSHTWRSTTGGERLKVSLSVSKRSSSKVRCSFSATAYDRFLGVWYQCHRKLDANVSAVFKYYSTLEHVNSYYRQGWTSKNFNYDPASLNTNQLRYSVDISGESIIGGDYSPRFNSYSVWADSDVVSAVNQNCQ